MASDVSLRDRILDDVAERVRQAEKTHAIGRLVSISVGEHKEVAVYVRGQASAAKRVKKPKISISPPTSSVRPTTSTQNQPGL